MSIRPVFKQAPLYSDTSSQYEGVSDWESVESSFGTAITSTSAPPPLAGNDPTPTLSTMPLENQQAPLEVSGSIIPGVYYIVNDQNHDLVLDVAGYDTRTVLAYGKLGGDNQKWEFIKFGAGYAIKSLINQQPGLYLSVEFGALENNGTIVSPFPVSWEMEMDPSDSGLYRIRWPNCPLMLDFPDINGHTVHLRQTYSSQSTPLWRLVPVEPPEHYRSSTTTNPSRYVVSIEQSTNSTPEPHAVSSGDTVIDLDRLTIAGSGEMAITTTTTTVTTSVTKIRRV